VTMTRAADQLIICAYSGVKENDQSWHSMISKALGRDETRCEIAEFSAGGEKWAGKIWRSTPRASYSEIAELLHTETKPDLTLPEGLFAPLPPTPFMPKPLSPSGAGIIIDADDAITPESSPLFGENGKFSSIALQRGRLVHRMLQMLPDLPESQWEEAAERYVSRAA